MGKGDGDSYIHNYTYKGDKMIGLFGRGVGKRLATLYVLVDVLSRFKKSEE